MCVCVIDAPPEVEGDVVAGYPGWSPDGRAVSSGDTSEVTGPDVADAASNPFVVWGADELRRRHPPVTSPSATPTGIVEVSTPAVDVEEPGSNHIEIGKGR